MWGGVEGGAEKGVSLLRKSCGHGASDFPPTLTLGNSVRISILKSSLAFPSPNNYIFICSQCSSCYDAVNRKNNEI